MATGRDDGKKGYAGLVSLVSEVASPALPTAASGARPDSTPSSAASSQAATERADAGPATRVKWGRIGVVCAGIAILLGLVIRSNDQGESAAPPASPSPSANAPHGAPASSALPLFSPPTESTRFEERRPGAATEQTLVGPELTYCVAQDLRLSTLQPLIEQNSEPEIVHFNRLVDDFNGRCSHYTYNVKEMIQVKAIVSSHHDQIVNQAMGWLKTWRASDVASDAGH
jgi:hypothetical protein